MKSKKLGSLYFEQKKYSSAIPFLKKAIRKAPKDDSLLTMLAYSYYYTRQLPASKKVLDYAQQKIGLSDTLQSLLFEVLKQQGQYKEAKKISTRKSNTWAIKKTYCDSSMAWLRKTKPVKVENMGNINTEYSERSPAWVPNGLIFLSNRETTVIRKKAGVDHLPYQQRYFARFNTDTIPFGTDLDHFFPEAKFHEGEIFFLADSGLAYYTETQLDNDNVLRSKLFEVKIEKDKAGKSKSFIFNDSLYTFMHPNLDQTGKIFFFSSNMEGGFGGMDLYASIKIDSSWQDPVNLGPIINTPHDEIHPFYDKWGRLIFSSNRPEGMGGFDQFVAYPKKGKWSSIKNLKAPVNSSADDLGLIHNGNSGYFYSNRKGGLGKEDIYKVSGRLLLLFDE